MVVFNGECGDVELYSRGKFLCYVWERAVNNGCALPRSEANQGSEETLVMPMEL